MNKALQSIIEERARQVEKFGEENCEMPIWLAVLMEEVGELSEVVLHDIYGGPESGRAREEAVQVAAVAYAIVQYIDRKKEQNEPAKTD